MGWRRPRGPRPSLRRAAVPCPALRPDRRPRARWGPRFLIRFVTVRALGRFREAGAEPHPGEVNRRSDASCRSTPSHHEATDAASAHRARARPMSVAVGELATRGPDVGQSLRRVARDGLWSLVAYA